MGICRTSKKLESEITKNPEAGHDECRDAKNGKDPHAKIFARLFHERFSVFGFR
jgi:hypothetical protein